MTWQEGVTSISTTEVSAQQGNGGVFIIGARERDEFYREAPISKNVERVMSQICAWKIWDVCYIRDAEKNVWHDETRRTKY